MSPRVASTNKTNPPLIPADLDFDDVPAAQRFLDFLQTRVWATREASPTLVGEPRTSILETAEQAQDSHGAQLA